MAGQSLGLGAVPQWRPPWLVGLVLFLRTNLFGSREIFELAHRAHHQFQGAKDSGIDVAAASFGGVLSSFSGAQGTSVSQTEVSSWPVGLRVAGCWNGAVGFYITVPSVH